ncbi:phosphoesterase [Methanovulcanius yangii]|uniref:phosphoesterase n=1 Tax=Methanovulcanius yangii TaxID=1789227 RepID=UPI0029CA0A0C|nr:phosphoesterase [Methanovulcanius yangii]
MKSVGERKGNVVHLTHNDLDAAGCDAIHRMHHSNVFTIWSSVGKFPRLLSALADVDGRGDILSISDLGYFPGAQEVLEKARSNNWRIEWRDHHRWTPDEIASVAERSEYLIVDTETCATGICARDLMPGNSTAGEIARVVCDYDLWKHLDPRSAPLGQVCTIHANLNPVRDRLARGILSDEWIQEKYAEIEKERENAIKKSKRRMVILGSRFRIAFAPLYGYPSETAHAIRDEFFTDIEVVYGKSGRFSIRSKPPISHLIARAFNGGGHPPAAGGTFSFTFIDRASLALTRKNHHFDDLVRIAEEIPLGDGAR